MSGSDFPEELEAEIKKVWAIADVNGDGKIDAKELEVLMQQLNRGLPPSKFEVERTLEMILGGRAASATEQIEYGQFKRAMGMWLSPSVSATAAKKREALESDDLSTRKRIHQNMALFFTQHSHVAKDWLSDAVAAQIADDPTYDPSNPLGRTFGNLSPEGMKEHFRWVDLNKDKYPEFLAQLTSSNPSDHLSGLSSVLQLLAIGETFNADSLSKEISAVILDVYTHIKLAGFPAAFIAFMNPHHFYTDDPVGRELTKNVWTRSLECLYQYVLGPRQPHLPADHPWHTSKLLQNKMELLGSGKPVLEWARIHLLSSAEPTIRARAARFLAAMAAQDDKMLVYVAAADIPKALLARVTDSVKPEPEDFVSGYLFALSIMCGETHPDFVFDPLAYGRLHCEDILKVFSVYLQHEPLRNSKYAPEVFMHVANGLSHLLVLPNVLDPAVLGLLASLIELPSFWHPAEQVPKGLAAIKAVLRCFRNLAVLPTLGPEILKYAIEKLELLRKCSSILSRTTDSTTRVAVVMLLEQVALQENTSKSLVTLVPQLVMFLQHETILRDRVTKLLAYLRKDKDVQMDFIRAGVVRSLVDCLSTISSTDDVMAGTYGFLSKTINYGFGLHALQALFFFAEVFDRPLAPTETPLTPADKLDILRAFGIHAVDQLDSFLNTILREKSRLGSDTFNRNSEAAECQRGLEFVFGKLKSMHTEHAMTGDVISSAIIDRLKGIEEHYIKWTASHGGATGGAGAPVVDDDDIEVGPLALTSQPSTSDMISIRTCHRGKAWTSEYAWGETYPRSQFNMVYLQRVLNEKYSTEVSIEFEAGAGLLSPLNTQASLSSAISAMEKLPAESRFLRLILSKKGYKGQGSGLEATNLLVGTNPSDLYRELRGHVLPGASKAITFHVNDSLIRNAQKYFAEKLVGKSGMSFQDFKAGIGEIVGEPEASRFAAMTDAELEAQFVAMDTTCDRDGVVSLKELLIGLSLRANGTYEEKIRLVFQVCDSSGDKKIDRSELEQLLTRAFPGATSAEIGEKLDSIMDTFDTDHSGALEFEEFRRMVGGQPAILELFFDPSQLNNRKKFQGQQQQFQGQGSSGFAGGGGGYGKGGGIRCNSCGELGHKSKQCPHAGGGASGGGGGKGKFCEICKRTNHVTSECRYGGGGGGKGKKFCEICKKTNHVAAECWFAGGNASGGGGGGTA